MEGDNALDSINETISRLQTSISSLEELLSLLAAPLDALGLLPPAFLRHNTRPFDNETKHKFSLVKHLPKIQQEIVTSIQPVWETVLQEERRLDLLYQYFCPDSFFSATQSAGEIALSAYCVTLSNPISDFSVNVLKRLSRHYPIDRMHVVVFGSQSGDTDYRRQSNWEGLLRNIFSIPTKAANYLQTAEIPQELRYVDFFAALFLRVECLVSSHTVLQSEHSASLLTLVEKMVLSGHFPASSSFVPNQPNFFATTLPKIRSQLAALHGEQREAYSKSWAVAFSSLQIGSFTSILSSLFSNCSELPIHEDSSDQSKSLIKREARLLHDLLGPLEETSDEKWTSISAALLTRCWSLSTARTLVCWAAVSDENCIPPRGVETLIQRTLEIWTSREHIKHSLLSQHQYLTTVLILSICHFPTSSSATQSVALSESFIDAIGEYIKHMDPAVRRCGMLATEIVAQRTGKALDFQQWEGQGQGREWAKALRSLTAKRDVDAEEAEPDIILLEQNEETNATENETSQVKANSGASVLVGKIAALRVEDDGSDSDDSLAGYASSDASSRPQTPTAAEMEEIEKDPSLNVGKKPVQRPVYLVDLGRLITESRKHEDPQSADKIEMALNCAEELIRRKKSFGYELEENAVNLTHALIFLNNNFNLDDFNEKRQGALNALVACCPRKAAPTIIQEFFNNQYSTEQRFAMLSALTLGARELAKLPIPSSQVPKNRASFPSKRLPQSQHAKYLTLDDVESGLQVKAILDGVARAAIESGKNSAESKVAPVVRSRKLHIGKTSAITEVSSQPMSTYVPKETSFSEVAAEFFIGPLVGRFWQFLHDEQSREMRSVHRETRYHSTGTGLILAPLVLSHFVQCLAVLMHAARHASEYLAVLVPETFELALTLGTRPMTSTEEDRALEAAVLTANLELALVVLDGCLELDGGRSLCLENMNVLVGVGDWATRVMELLEKGVRTPGQGGSQEAKIGRAAAGVVLKVDELTSKWRQSMFPI